jgi:hypothetical protein
MRRGSDRSDGGDGGEWPEELIKLGENHGIAMVRKFF